MNLLDRALQKLAMSVEAVEKAIDEIRVPKYGVPERAALGLLTAVVERAKIIATALKDRGVSSAFLLVRSQLELTVDLVNLEKDKGYMDVLLKIDLLTRKRYLEYAAEAGAEEAIFRQLASDPKRPTYLAGVNSDLAALEPESGNHISTKWKARFKSAGMEEDYKAKYTYFSQYVHGHQVAIFDAYFRQEGQDLRFILDREASEEETVMIVDTAAFCLARSIHSVNQIFGGSIADRVDEARRAWEQLSDVWKKMEDRPAGDS